MGEEKDAVRDLYGFLVPPERVTQYRQDAVIVMEREEAQAEAWERFFDEEAESERPPSENENDPATVGDDSSGLNGKAPVTGADSECAAVSTSGSVGAESSSSVAAQAEGTQSAEGRRSSSSDELLVLRSAILRRVLDLPLDSPERQRLRELVEAGVPMAMRKFVWPLFLDKHEEDFDEYINARHSSSASSSTKATFIKSIYLKSHARKKFAPLPDYKYQLKNISVSCTGWVEQIKKPRSALQLEGSSLSDICEPASAPSPHALATVKDLPRTFPHHPALEGRGRSALGRVLAAYVAYNSVDGYCQGMNFIAGLLILFLPEETAFKSFAQLLKCILQGYHAQDLKTLLVDQLVFDHLLKDRFPDVEEHLTYLGVKSSAVTAHWFLTAFVNTLQMQALLRVWDVLLFEGSISVLMRMALAMVKSRREIVLAMEDSADVLAALQQMPANTSISEMDALLVDVCCNYPEVTDEKINELRLDNLKTVDEEARNLLVNRKPSEMSKFFTKLSTSVSKSFRAATAAAASSDSHATTTTNTSHDPDTEEDLDTGSDSDERMQRSMSTCVTSEERQAALLHESTAAGATSVAKLEVALTEERMLKEAAMRELEATREAMRALQLQNTLLEEKLRTMEEEGAASTIHRDMSTG